MEELKFKKYFIFALPIQDLCSYSVTTVNNMADESKENAGKCYEFFLSFLDLSN